jgi:hypothetical protein
LEKDYKEDIKIDDNIIIIKDKLQLNNIIAFLVRNSIFIKDIFIKENSLLKMFKEEI